MKKLLLMCFICLIGRIGFAQGYDGTATITIEPPVGIYDGIVGYCLEYCKTEDVHTDTAWRYISVSPEMSYNFLTGRYEYVETIYSLTGLDPNTLYTVRVHAYYNEYNEYSESYLFGEYGSRINFMTPEYEGSVSVEVNCGRIPLEGGDWHPIYVSSLSQEFLERTLYCIKEEWNFLT